MDSQDRIRLDHMLQAATSALSFAAGKSREDLSGNEMLVMALVKAVEIVGEAASRVSFETREQTSQLPWQDMIGMRHRLVHGYFDINLDVLWSTVQEDLPPLVAALKQILQ